MIKVESKGKQDQRRVDDALCSFRTPRSEILSSPLAMSQKKGFSMLSLPTSTKNGLVV